jgi:GST-like protein
MDRYRNEANRLYNVLDRRLGECEYLAGSEYSIADMAVWPWTRRPERQGVDRDEYPNFKRWFETIEARPAVERGVQVLAEHQMSGTLSEEDRRNMFGEAQYARR